MSGKPREYMGADINLARGLTIDGLANSCCASAGEWLVYDQGIPIDAADHTSPMDVLATAAVNSFIDNSERLLDRDPPLQLRQ
jgi:hypothetical protein